MGWRSFVRTEVFLAGTLALTRLGLSQASPATNAPTTLPPVIVEAPRFPDRTAPRSYTVSNAPTATWTAMPVSETPLSIQAIPKAVIEDQGVDRLKDVYRNVSGVAPLKTESQGIQFENAYVRGFSQRLSLSGFNCYTMPTIDLYGVQQVEVLKGPSSSLYGAIEPGGLINVIPKFPEFVARTEIFAEVGSYDHVRSGFDSTGPLTSNLAYRAIYAYEDSNSFRDGLHHWSMFAAPSLTYVFEDRTRLTAWLWYQYLNRPVDNGVAFTYDGHPAMPITRNLAGPYHNTQTIQDTVGGLELDHPVSDLLTLQSKFLVHSFDSTYDGIRWSSVSAANTIAPYYDASSFNNLELDYIADALWKFELGPTKHQVMAGFELSRSDYFYDRLTDSTLSPISIFTPVYPTGPFTHLVAGAAEQETLTEDAAGFVQEQMDALDNTLHLLVGGRADHVDQHYVSWSNGKITDQDDLGLCGRAGLLYDLTPWLSPYACISRSFNPNTAGSNATFDGHPLDPTTGIEYESGLKFSLFEKRLLLTTAAFQLTKEHVAVQDKANSTASTTYYADAGVLRSEGFETDIIGQITPELQVVGNYTYDDTRVVKSNVLPAGAALIDVPVNSGSLWLKYTFQDGPLEGFGAGAGAFASDERAGDNNNTFDLPGYIRWDTGAWYAWVLQSGQRIKLQANIYNLFDRTYYESSSSAANVEPGTPLSFLVRLSVIF